MNNDLRIIIGAISAAFIIFFSILAGYEMGKKKFPMQGGATINCEYTFPTLETKLETE